MKTYLIAQSTIPSPTKLVGHCLTQGYKFSRLETMTHGVKSFSFIIEVSSKENKAFLETLKNLEIYDFILVSQNGKASKGKKVLGQFKEVSEANLNDANYLHEGKTFSIV